MASRKIFTTKLQDGREAELYGKEAGDLEIYVDGAWGITASSSGVKINLFTVAPNDGAAERREVAVRLAMSHSVLFQLQEFLENQCTALKEMGAVVELESPSTTAESKKPND